MIWKKYLLTKVLITTGIVGIFATPQITDKLVYKGDTISVYLNLLPKEFYKPKVKSAFDTHLAVNLFGNKKACVQSSCWDGYQTMWEIVENQLYLTGIYSCCFYKDSIKADLTSLFKGKVIKGKVKADWVTKAIVRGGKGFILWNRSNDMPVFAQEFEFVFFKGKLLYRMVFDNSKSRESTYATNEMKLIKFIYSNIRWDKLPKQKEKIKVRLTFSANENGKIDDIELVRSADKIFNQEAIRVIKSIPDWNVIYQKGQHCRQWFSMSIVFSEENRKEYRK